MANIINKRINNTNNTKEDASMENKIMYIQQAYSIDTMLPGGGFFGGEQTDVLPGGGFHGGEQTDVLPGGGFHGDLIPSQETSNDVKTDETSPPWMTGVYGHCTFPSSFSKNAGRIGFEKEGDAYALFIDKGITCSKSNTSQLFRDWLSAGTLRF